MKEWIGVDLDGTLAFYDHWRGPEHIGEPIPAMLERVRGWIADGKTVKVFTARAFDPLAIPPIRDWLESHGLESLDVTNVKDYGMIELWDDRSVRVVCNEGRPCCGHCGSAA